ncbi:unnamed protein product, partial [Ascophyllum nodosum]
VRDFCFTEACRDPFGQEPRCLGYKSLLPGIQVTEEDLVPPPPEKSKFIFISVGISVYNKEMLSRNQLPLVNGISQLIISEEIASRGDLPRRDGGRQGRHWGDEREHAERPHELPEGVMAKDDLASDVFPRAQQRRHVVADGNEREEARKEAQQKIDALFATARDRVQRQYNITVELARATPGKIPQAAKNQASKAKEMPGMMGSTAKKGLDLGTFAVRSLTDQLSDDKDEKK